MARRICLLVAALICAPVKSDLVTHVIDTGDGLTTVTRFPDDSIMVYSTGHYQRELVVMPAFRDFIGTHDVDLLIVSHANADHLGATDELFNEYWVHQVIRNGDGGGRGTNYTNHYNAINEAEAAGLTFDVNLVERELPVGTEFEFSDATVTFLSGHHAQPKGWSFHGGEPRNGISVVVRVAYEGHWMLFTDDAVGRDEGDPAGDDHIIISLRDVGVPTLMYNSRESIEWMTTPNLQSETADDTGTTDTRPTFIRSGSGNCHNQESTWYESTHNFTAFSSLDACLTKGGRLPRR